MSVFVSQIGGFYSSDAIYSINNSEVSVTGGARAKAFMSFSRFFFVSLNLCHVLFFYCLQGFIAVHIKQTLPVGAR